ncbi:MAG TPA: biotin transporter BioY [Ktedonobacterales bacterium]|nr:biotin transporter BioY [Ktedonobacterales bacterium]
MPSSATQRGALMDVISSRAATGARPRSAVISWLWKEGALALVGVALLALSARVIIPLPFSPVPITGQTFAVLLIAAAYGAQRGLATVALYILAGIAGAPVFAAVPGVASYGYIAGFALAAIVVGWLAERGWDRTLLRSIFAMLAGEVAIYLCGLVWLARFVGWGNVIALGLVPFVVGDATKLLVAALLLPAAWRAVNATFGQEAR